MQKEYDLMPIGRIPYRVWSYILCINSYAPFGDMPLVKRTNIEVLSDWRHTVSPMTNRLKAIHSLVRSRKAIAITISRLYTS